CLACDPCGGDVDLAKLALEAVRLELVTCSAERVRFDNVGTGLDVFLVHLADKIGSDEIQFVVAPVDVNSFIVEPRSNRPVEDIDAVVVQDLSEVLHSVSRSWFVVRCSLTSSVTRRSSGDATN